jgi:hypothetical protein
MNPHADDTRRHGIDPTRLGLESMVVTQANEHIAGDDVGHHVEVAPDLFSTSMTAEVLGTQAGDITIPTEGDTVIVSRRTDDNPVVLGYHYPQEKFIQPYKPGERRIGHPTSDSYIRLKQNGTIQIQHDTPANKTAVVRFQQDGGVAMHDHKGYGIECQNNGEVHIYGKVKQHTSQTLDLAE